MRENHDPRRRGRKSVSRRLERSREDYERLLRLLLDREFSRLAEACQGRHQRLDSRIRRARYEDAGVAVGVIHAVNANDEVKDSFFDDFHHVVGRELKPKRLQREVFLFLYGEARKDVAGTDALALEEAVRRGIAAEDIPEYIRDSGGMQSLLHAERRRRDQLVLLEVSIRRSAMKRLDALHLGAKGDAVIMRSWAELPRTTAFAIVEVRSS